MLDWKVSTTVCIFRPDRSDWNAGIYSQCWTGKFWSDWVCVFSDQTGPTGMQGYTVSFGLESFGPTGMQGYTVSVGLESFGLTGMQGYTVSVELESFYHCVYS